MGQDETGALKIRIAELERLSGEHKKTEAALRESEERFRTIFGEAVDGMILADANTKSFLMCNRSACRMLGYEEEELLRLSVADIHPAQDLPKVLETFELQAQGKLAAVPTLPVKRKDGSVFFADVSASVLKISGKRYMMGSFRDITEKKKAQEAVASSEANYRAIFESVNDAIIIRDADTYDIVDCNRKACEMFCYTKEEMVGFRVGALTADTERHPNELLREYYRKSCELEPQIFEWLVRDKFGREFWIEINLKCAVISGRRRLLYIARDINERKQLMESKEDFINMVSHELRTPLGAIREGVLLVIEEKFGQLNEKQKEMLSIAQRNVDRLTRLITQVLDIQKFEAGRMRLDLEQGDINSLVEEVYASMVSMVSKKHLGFTFKLEDNLPRLRFDRDKITQVLQNLINNAAENTEKGAITVTTSAQGNCVKVSVADTGCGISGNEMSKLFQRFTQIRKKPGGSGLGLAICKEIIDKHKGKIAAESEPGKGTTFHFILPVKERRL